MTRDHLLIIDTTEDIRIALFDMTKNDSGYTCQLKTYPVKSNWWHPSHWRSIEEVDLIKNGVFNKYSSIYKYFIPIKDGFSLEFLLDKEKKLSKFLLDGATHQTHYFWNRESRLLCNIKEVIQNPNIFEDPIKESSVLRSRLLFKITPILTEPSNFEILDLWLKNEI